MRGPQEAPGGVREVRISHRASESEWKWERKRVEGMHSEKCQERRNKEELIRN